MTTLDFAERNVTFSKPATPITGRFNLAFYPFLRKPMEAADDITCKRLVIYKASSCMGSVLGEIITTKRIACDVGDQISICQTDEKAKNYFKTRLRPWLGIIPDLRRLLSSDKYAVTGSLIQFRHKDVFIFGPGINSAQSDQVRYVQSDESHLDAYEPGALIEWEKRMGAKWHRQATHITTAPDAGKEVDGFYKEGQQDEWHFRCPNCHELFWPLWGEDAIEKYGKDVFRCWPDGMVSCICPHCEWLSKDTARDRYALVKDGDYVAQNPLAGPETRSFRWSCFAAHWIDWRSILLESQAAMEAAKLGNLKPLEDFEKKRLCKAWIPRMPHFGTGRGSQDYKLGDKWEVTDSIRTLTMDPQAGKDGEGFHVHGFVDEFDRAGNSRRIAYRRLPSFDAAHAMATEFHVPEMGRIHGRGVSARSHVMIDGGHDLRTVLRAASRFGWYVYRGSDAQQFHIKDGKSWAMPYSTANAESGTVGASVPKKQRQHKGGALPSGWAWVITGCNPELDGYLSALIGGTSGRYFGIPSDFDSLFTVGDLKDGYSANMPARVMRVEKDPKTNRDKKPVWVDVRPAHAWDCERMALVVAARLGYFPLAKTEPQTT